ncbi:hypothetical protein C8R46DRAFT_465295 [Mycena filopes]|nr:hypothetical protein C8R46DRAFT_465295 [Mycena filopes]
MSSLSSLPASSAPAQPSSSAPAQPSSSAPPPPSSSPPPPPASSSAVVSSSAPPPPSSTITSSSAVTSASPSSLPVHLSTDSSGGVVTLTQTQQVTQTNPAGASQSATVRTSTKGFLQNKGAVAAVFTIVGLVAAGLLFALITNVLRRRRARRFDREIAEEAKRAPAPVFVDDDEDYASGGYHSDPYSAGPTAYHDGGYGGGAVAGDPYAAAGGAATVHSAPSEYPASDAVHSGSGVGTPSNYMYPSGYSDLGFSDVSSHGTYSQPPMDAYGNAGAGAYGGGGYHGGAGVGAGMAAGAYEMMGYPQQGHNNVNGGGGQQQTMAQQEWQHQQNQGMVAQVGYAYPGEEQQQHQQQGYPPAPTAQTNNSSGSDVMRSKSAGRSLVDSYGSGPAAAASAGSGGVGAGDAAKQPHYADGYVSQYQTGHVVEDAGAYGGLETSQHGHIGGMDDEEESDGEGDGRRVLKVANE